VISCSLKEELIHGEFLQVWIATLLDRHEFLSALPQISQSDPGPNQLATLCLGAAAQNQE